MSSLWNHFIGVSILVLLAIFVGIWVWAWRPSHRRTFDALAQLPMEDLAMEDLATQDLNDDAGSRRSAPKEAP